MVQALFDICNDGGGADMDETKVKTGHAYLHVRKHVTACDPCVCLDRDFFLGGTFFFLCFFLALYCLSSYIRTCSASTIQYIVVV